MDIPRTVPPPRVRGNPFHLPINQFSALLNESFSPSHKLDAADFILPGRPLKNSNQAVVLSTTQSFAPPAASLIHVQAPWKKPTIFSQAPLKKSTKGPANQAPIIFRKSQMWPQTMTKNAPISL